MKMSRGQMLSIINSMSDEKISEALQATGVETGCCDYELGGEEAEGLESWNARDVSVEATPRPPIIDKAKFEKPGQVMMQRPKYHDEEELAGYADFIPMQQGIEGGGF